MNLMPADKHGFIRQHPIACVVDVDTQIRYNRILGGISWPGIHPGVAVLFGAAPQIKGYELHFFGETEDEDLRTFVSKIQDLQNKFFADLTEWYGDTEDKVARNMVRDQAGSLSLSRAPFLGDPQRLYSYGIKINERVKNKTLLYGGVYGGTYKLPYIDRVELREAQPADHPFLTALGSAVAAAKNISPIDPGHDDEDQDYDILKWGLKR